MLHRLKSPLKEVREAQVSPSSWNEDEYTFEVTWTTGSRGLRRSWSRGKYYESLSVDPKHVRMQRLQSGAAPFLDAHNGWSNKAVLGRIVEASVDGQRGWAKVQASKAPSAADTVFKIREGTLRGVSVGYEVHAYELIRGETEEDLDEYRGIDWEPYEVSSVPMAFDMDAQVRCLRDLNPDVPVFEPDSPKPEQERDMGAENKPDNVVDLEQVKREAAATAAKEARQAEKQRVTGIRASAEKLGIEDAALVERLINDDVAIDEARAQLIDAHEAQTRSNTPETDTHIGAGGSDEADHQIRGVAEALMWRARPEAYKVTEVGQKYRYCSLMDLARMAAEASGFRTVGKSKIEIIERALKARGAWATTDYSTLLVETGRRMLRDAYEEEAPTYKMVAARRVAPDFKANKEVILSGAATPEKILEGGEFKRGTMTTQSITWALATWGQKVAITLQAIMGDDLGAFRRIFPEFGYATSRMEDLEFFTLLVSNPNVYDGNPMFSAARGNVLKGGAGGDPGKAQYSLMRKIVRTQEGLTAGQKLRLPIRYMLGAAGQETNMDSMLVPTTPETTGNAIPPKLRYEPIVSPHLDDTDEDLYFGVADPARQPSMIYGHLEGMENGPRVEQRESWDTLGIEMRMSTFFATAAADWRGWVLNDQNDALSTP